MRTRKRKGRRKKGWWMKGWWGKTSCPRQMTATSSPHRSRWRMWVGVALRVFLWKPSSLSKGPLLGARNWRRQWNWMSPCERHPTPKRMPSPPTRYSRGSPRPLLSSAKPHTHHHNSRYKNHLHLSRNPHLKNHNSRHNNNHLSHNNRNNQYHNRRKFYSIIL